MSARTAWAWCSLKSNRRIKRCWKNGWPRFATSTNAPRARGSFPDKFSIRGNGAVERTRTSTVLLPPAPQAGASASSATTAFHRLDDYRGERNELRGSRPLALKIYAKPTVSSVVPAQAASLPEAASPAAALIAAALLEREYCLELIAVRPVAACQVAASVFLVPLVLPAQASRISPALSRPAQRPYPCAAPEQARKP